MLLHEPYTKLLKQLFQTEVPEKLVSTEMLNFYHSKIKESLRDYKEKIQPIKKSNYGTRQL